jgi:hypothetical protein
MVAAFHQTMANDAPGRPFHIARRREFERIERSFGTVPTASLPFSASVQVVSGPAISAPSGV